MVEGARDEPTSLHVQRAIGGDHGSLTWIVRRLSPLLLAQARYRLGPRLASHYEPEDLVQEAWMVALPRLAELQPRDGRFTPVVLRFLSTTLLYRIQNLVRRHATGAVVGDAVRLEELADDERTGIVSRAVRAERRDAVQEAIAELEEIDREIVVLRGIEQQANKTVAMLLDMKTQTIAMRYKRALEKLRNRLPGSVFDEFAD